MNVSIVSNAIVSIVSNAIVSIVSNAIVSIVSNAIVSKSDGNSCPSLTVHDGRTLVQ